MCDISISLREADDVPAESDDELENTQVRLRPNKRHLNFDSILIITYGRSGSTLLQGILNSIDGCLIRGENYNAIFYLFEFYEKIILNKKENYNQTMPNNPFYGAGLPDEELVLMHIQNMVHDLLLADKIDASEIWFFEDSCGNRCFM